MFDCTSDSPSKVVTWQSIINLLLLSFRHCNLTLLAYCPQTLQYNAFWKISETFNRYRICWLVTVKHWGKVFKNGPSKICGTQMVCLRRPYHFKYFKGCLPQILLGPFLNISVPFDTGVKNQNCFVI